MKNSVFWAVTCSLVAIITFCIGGTVKSQSNLEEMELEYYYQEKEAELLAQTKEYLADKGYANSGVTLTRIVDEEGCREYTFTIHHRKIDRMSEQERQELTEELAQICILDDRCSFHHEFL